VFANLFFTNQAVFHNLTLQEYYVLSKSTRLTTYVEFVIEGSV